MPSSIQYKKIYIDSKYRSSDSNSSSDFKYELGLSKLPIGNTPPESEIIKLILKQKI